MKASLLTISRVILRAQDERPKPPQQFTMRFGTTMDKMSVSRNSRILGNKLEKEKVYEGMRLPMTPTGGWVFKDRIKRATATRQRL